ncbi:Zinc finger CCCH domain-containing protein 53 [Vitis vinifera]|uniref:Zinc finger CCCH domain-containing protein 53 n=1 Tax=Vitis vinifera TaxID=29760 RepID=A0A438DZ57_VITVI|nr:Zinc finger CCCH domain-containing protein 53 [Vitis vinifera]
MDAYEATRIVFSRIQNLDPENASKIMGLLLIQDHGEKEMIRLAFGPEALVHSVILKARKELGISSTLLLRLRRPPLLLPFSLTTHFLSPGKRLSLLPLRVFLPQDDLISPNSGAIPYTNSNGINGVAVGSSSSAMNSSSSPFYGGNDLIDEFQLQDQLSFLNDGSPTLGPKNPDLFYSQQELASSPGGGSGGDAMGFPSYGWGAAANGLPHRRSCSVSDICLASDDPASGFGWKPCLYFARGYCKNGTSCRFLHGGDSASVVGSEGAAMVGSPSKIEMMEQCHELLRSKSAQQQSSSRPILRGLHSSQVKFLAFGSFPCIHFSTFHSSRAAAALMMGDDMHKFGRSRLERGEFMNGGAGMVNPGSRQIYLTFPADSTFREEDVSNYFSIFGPVQDVRIPYQQKRMFGFVTFVYPETVKLILAKGNPHFVCDARVLVKPYKEKGKVPDKKQQQQQQQVERGEFSACSTPTGLDSRDPYDLQLGARMFYNTQDMLWRRKLEEQADLQQAIELQGRRLMGLQLLDVKKQQHHRALSTGAPIPSPTHSPSFFNQPLILPSDRSSPEAPEENCSSPATAIPVNAVAAEQQQQTVTTAAEKEFTGIDENGNGTGKESSHNEDSDLPESLEHNLPDSPFASPTKGAGEYLSTFSNASSEVEKNTTVSGSPAVNGNLITSSLLPATSTLDMASFKSCYFQMPRQFSSLSCSPLVMGPLECRLDAAGQGRLRSITKRIPHQTRSVENHHHHRPTPPPPPPPPPPLSSILYYLLPYKCIRKRQ